jgi:NADH dehydrogenase [ubiquinone] 1 alpha subcomplex assembly factor 6
LRGLGQAAEAMSEPGGARGNSLTTGAPDLAARARSRDPDRYLTALFAPAERRSALFALIAFNDEIARVRETVTQPILGQIRLQWWRDAVEQIYNSKPPAHDVAQALAAAVADASLDRMLLERMIDARESDLASEPPAHIEELLSYAADTAGSLVELQLQALGARDEASEQAGRSVGTAYALVGLIRAIPFHARARRAYVPQSVLAEKGLTSEDLFRSEPPVALRSAVRELAGLARLHLVEAREHAGTVPRRAASALLAATVAENYLRAIERARYDVFSPSVSQRPPGLVWRLAFRAWAGLW